MNDTSVFATVLLPLALALIMGTLGLSLTPADFKRIFTRPRGVLIGLANLLLISPLLAFAVAELYGLEPAFAVGLVLLGASPGGTLANLLTHLARGDTALSITMTALSSVASVVTVPLFLTLAVNHFDASVGNDVSMLGVVARVFAITIIPLAIGMRIRARNPGARHRARAAAKRLAFAVFAGVVVGAVVERVRHGHRPLHRAGARGPHAERGGDDHLVLDRPPRTPRRAPVHGDRDGARVAQRRARDRRRHLDRRPARHSGRRLQRLPALHRGRVRAA